MGTLRRLCRNRRSRFGSFLFDDSEPELAFDGWKIDDVLDWQRQGLLQRTLVEAARSETRDHALRVRPVLLLHGCGSAAVTRVRRQSSAQRSEIHVRHPVLDARI